MNGRETIVESHVGLFVTHEINERIKQHFNRLKRETAGLVHWEMVFNPEGNHLPVVNFSYINAAECMPFRLACVASRVVGGGLDICVLPCAAAFRHKFVWIIEFDVDYAGHWSNFFSIANASNADLLTTTIQRWTESKEWFWWTTAEAPSNISKDKWHRGFLPLMRLSPALIDTYIGAISTGNWRGHYEFTLPTICASFNLVLEDLITTRPERPFYRNTPEDGYLSPGTFVWRPAILEYFHETARLFEYEECIYHPIKSGTIPAVDSHQKSGDVEAALDIA